MWKLIKMFYCLRSHWAVKKPQTSTREHWGLHAMIQSWPSNLAVHSFLTVKNINEMNRRSWNLVCHLLTHKLKHQILRFMRLKQADCPNLTQKWWKLLINSKYIWMWVCNLMFSSSWIIKAPHRFEMKCLIFFHSVAVREFLCLDDPPGPFDSLEESRVSVQSLFVQHSVC